MHPTQDPLLFRNVHTQQVASLFFGSRPSETVTMADGRVFPMAEVKIPQPDDFMEQYQWPYMDGDHALRQAVRDYASKLINYNPLTTSVCMARHKDTDEVVVAVGVATMDWLPEPEEGTPAEPEPPGGLRVQRFAHMITHA